MTTQQSLWTETARHATSYPSLSGQREFDVAVIGAGITGVTTALLLKRAGLRVGLVEMERVGSGVTGHTTAKITSLHRLIYAALASSFNPDTARVYAEANESGLHTIAALVEELALDCAFERRPAVTYTCEQERRGAVEDEAAAAAAAGLPARLVEDTDLPFGAVAAVQVDNQAQFHPLDYLHGLARAVDGDGSAVFEGSRVIDVRTGSPSRVETPDGAIMAADVVVATHLPLLDRGLFFAKAHPSRSYAIAARIDGPLPQGMYINVEEPTRSVRPYVRGDEGVLIIGGESHKPGDGSDELARWAALESWARAHFPVTEITNRWAAHDYVPVDKMPYIGRLSRSTDHVWTATGYRKWGFTSATMAAEILTALIQGREHPWAETFNANRLTPVQSARSFVCENLQVARHFIGDRLSHPGWDCVNELEPGSGQVVRIDGEAYAVSRDADGQLRSVSPVCTHMGCHVGWNAGERLWECPCHGSRFTPDGTVAHGPAMRDLEAKDLPDQ